MKPLLRNDTVIGALLALVALAVYLLTLSPTVNSLDGGELAASAATLGVAHPTGYPLFTLLGRLVASLPVGGSVILKLNMLTALCAAAAVFFFYRFFIALLQGFGNGTPRARTRPHDKAGTPDPQGPERVAAAAAVLALAFSRTYWMQALSYEVYALHALFLSVVLLAVVRAIRSEGPAAQRAWLLAAYLYGLAFTNHLMMVVLVPACVFLVAAAKGAPALTRLKARTRSPVADALQILGVLAAVFLLGLSVYLYLPVRAALNPAMNWGDPSTLENLRWHVTGRQFWPHMFYSWDLALWKFGEFARAFPSEFGLAPLAGAVAGCVHLARRNRPLLAFVLLLAGVCIGYSINYGITDIESYYLQAYVAVAACIAFGVRAVARRTPSPRLRAAVLAACVLACLSPLAAHYRTVDLSEQYAAQDYARNLLESATPGSVLLTDTDGRLTMIGFYLQFVEGVRPDVVLVDRGYLAYPYYAKQLERNHPWLRDNLRLAESAGGFNAGLTLPEVDAGLRDFVARNHDTRAIYITDKIAHDFFPGLGTVPTGLLFRLAADTLPALPPPRTFRFRPLDRPTADNIQIRDAYAVAYFNEGAYRLWLGERDAGITLLRNAVALKPDFLAARNMLLMAQSRPQPAPEPPRP